VDYKWTPIKTVKNRKRSRKGMEIKRGRLINERLKETFKMLGMLGEVRTG
jgi:hypothetical protein